MGAYGRGETPDVYNIESVQDLAQCFRWICQCGDLITNRFDHRERAMQIEIVQELIGALYIYSVGSEGRRGEVFAVVRHEDLRSSAHCYRRDMPVFEGNVHARDE